MKTLIVVFCLLLFACSKQPDDYTFHSKGEQVEFTNSTGCRLQVMIENWGTGFEIYPGDSHFMDSFRETDGQNILGKRFICWRWVDNSLQYTGHGIVKSINELIRESLDQDTIKFHQP